MPKFRVNVNVEQKGAIFNASASKAAAARAVIQVNELIAQEAYHRIQARLSQVLQHPTGYYQSRIVIDRKQIYRGVSDSNVIYGGWLEGISSRNRATRFKGYHTFRGVRQSIDRDKIKIAQPAVTELVRKLQ